MSKELQDCAREILGAETVPPIEDCFDKNPTVPRNAWLSAKALACDYLAQAKDREKPITGSWMQSIGWSFHDDRVSSENNFWYLAVDEDRHLEMSDEKGPIVLFKEWDDICRFKNDGTRGPIMDLMRILDL